MSGENKMRNFRLALLPLLLLLVGCANYRVTTPLEQPLSENTYWYIGDIVDALPADTELEDRPDEFVIDQLRGMIYAELVKRATIGKMGVTPDDADLLVTGSILEYKKGSGFLRFLIGFGAGNAVVTVELKAADTKTGKTVFAGNFKQTVSSWSETGDKCFERIAKDFAKAVEKEQKKLTKN